MTDAEIERIARSYFSTERDQAAAKDAIEEALQLAAPAATRDARLAELEARHATDDDLWHIAGVVAELSGGNLFNVSQHECVTAIRAAFMDPDAGRALLAAALKQPVPAPQGEGK